MACCFTVAGYAAVQLLTGRTVAVAVWFIGAALLHELVLVPVYSAADRAARTALPPHKDHKDRSAERLLLNHLRTPVALSLSLLLVRFPLILRRSTARRRHRTRRRGPAKTDRTGANGSSADRGR
ncbi:hypothetical protein ABZY02_32365 [Streptomyces sp. NPDC006649]|uniref:hypothetical protein n=1 Tax=Streptomyces sp. NPDC006649 TaxID=3156896 RepID=UPI0033BCC780